MSKKKINNKAVGIGILGVGSLAAIPVLDPYVTGLGESMFLVFGGIGSAIGAGWWAYKNRWKELPESPYEKTRLPITTETIPFVAPEKKEKKKFKLPKFNLPKFPKLGKPVPVEQPKQEVWFESVEVYAEENQMIEDFCAFEPLGCDVDEDSLDFGSDEELVIVVNEPEVVYGDEKAGTTSDKVEASPDTGFKTITVARAWPEEGREISSGVKEPKVLQKVVKFETIKAGVKTPTLEVLPITGPNRLEQGVRSSPPAQVKTPKKKRGNPHVCSKCGRWGRKEKASDGKTYCKRHWPISVGIEGRMEGIE